MKTLKFFASLSIVSMLLIFMGCSCEPTISYSYHLPELLNDGFEVGSLEEVRIDSALLKKAVDEINCGEYGEVHSMTIFKAGKLAFETYFQGHRYQWDSANHHGAWITWDKSTQHGVKSVSKSIVSTCVAVALDKGFIKSVHQSIFDYLPDHQHLRTSDKENISIEHLLTMTSGLEWNEWSLRLNNTSNDVIGVWFQDKDPVSYILDKPLMSTPGTAFNYSSGNTVVLGEIIKNASNMALDKFSEEYVFKPLGIEASHWAVRYDNGVIDAGGGLEITPRDMVKIGVMYLNNGVFNGRRVISKQWVEHCTTQFSNNKDIDIPGHASGIHGYSYSWWLKSHTISGKKIDMYNAVGWGGQQIVVIPEFKTVVAFTGGNYVSNVKVFEILEKYILPAID